MTRRWLSKNRRGWKVNLWWCDSTFFDILSIYCIQQEQTPATNCSPLHLFRCFCQASEILLLFFRIDLVNAFCWNDFPIPKKLWKTGRNKLMETRLYTEQQKKWCSARLFHFSVLIVAFCEQPPCLTSLFLLPRHIDQLKQRSLKSVHLGVNTSSDSIHCNCTRRTSRIKKQTRFKL